MRVVVNYKYALIALTLPLAAIQCHKTGTATVPTANVIYIHSSSTSVLADGSSLDTIYADLPINTQTADLGVTFQSNSGLFANGFDTMSVIANRIGITPNKITAVVIWQASLRSGPDTIEASTTSTIPLYTNMLTLTLLPSVADSIQLIPSAYMLTNSFGAQVTIIGTLTNSNGGEVSEGITVRFVDEFAAGGGGTAGTPAGGAFYPPVANIDTSKVTTTYFPVLSATGATFGNYITITATAFDANGNSVGRPGKTTIYITP